MSSHLKQETEEGGGGGHSRGSLETQICKPLPRICSISWDPFQIKWLFRGSYPGELPCDGSLHFEHREKLVVGFYKFGTKEYWPVFVLALSAFPQAGETVAPPADPGLDLKSL